VGVGERRYKYNTHKGVDCGREVVKIVLSSLQRIHPKSSLTISHWIGYKFGFMLLHEMGALLLEEIINFTYSYSREY
jgi:hypothetical protein